MTPASGDHAVPSEREVPSCRPPIQERLRERVVTTFPRCGKCEDCKVEESILPHIKESERQGGFIIKERFGG